MEGLVICIKLNSYIAHILYAWSFIHNVSVPILIKHNKYYLSLYTNTTVFAWGDINQFKIENIVDDHCFILYTR